MNAPALTETFSTFAGVSWRASWLIVAFVLLRFAVRGRIPAQVWFLAWIVVAARLLLPFSVPAAWSPYNLAASQPAPAAQIERVENTPVARIAATPERVPTTTHPTVVEGEMQVRAPVAFVPIFAQAWLGGVLVLALVRGMVSWRFRRRLREATPATDPRLHAIVAREAAEGGITATVASVETDAVDAPALFGVLRPRLLFPVGLTTQLSDEELRLVVRHELAHWRRRDLPAQLLLQAAVVVHWFNPLVWLAARLARTDCELACDEFVLRREKNDGAKAYGATLLKVLGVTRPHRRRPIAVVGILEGKQQLSQRVRRIAGYRVASVARIVVGAGVIAAFAVASATREARAVEPVATRAAGSAPSASESGPAFETQRLHVEQLARDLQDYREKHNLLGLDNRRNIEADALKALNAEVQRTVLALNLARTRFEQVRERRERGADLLQLPFIANQPLIQQLTQQIATVNISLAEMAQRYLEKHPRVKDARNKLAAIEAELHRAVDSACQQVEAEHQAALRNHEHAQRELALRKDETVALERQAGDYARRAAELRTQEQALQIMMARAGERNAATGSAREGTGGATARELTISVIGGVNQQGAFTFAPKEKPIVLDAIARAGGFAPGVARNSVRLIRLNASGIRASATLTEEQLMGGTSEAVLLQAGDVVVVPDAPPAELPRRTASIMGAVNSPGRFELMSGEKLTVIDFIMKAGGLSRVADAKKVRVTRMDLAKKTTTAVTIDVARILAGSTPTDAEWETLTIEPNDVVTVPERIL